MPLVPADVNLGLNKRRVVLQGFRVQDLGGVRVGDLLKIVGEGLVARCTGDTDVVAGVAEHSAFDGQPISVAINGIVRLVANGSVAIDDAIGPTSVPGRAVQLTPGLLSAPKPSAKLRALSSAMGAGKVFWAYLNVDR